MNIIETKIKGIKVIEPDLFGDERGYFVESFQKEKYAEILNVSQDAFTQDNISRSDKGILRGLHFQKAPHAQGKLVSVLKGSVFDVVVDIRKDSVTFGKYFSIILREPVRDKRYSKGKWQWQQLWIPSGFAHGFLALEDDTLFTYKCAHAYYAPESDAGIMWNDGDIGIEWPFSEYNIEKPILSDKDKKHPKLNEITL